MGPKQFSVLALCIPFHLGKIGSGLLYTFASIQEQLLFRRATLVGQLLIKSGYSTRVTSNRANFRVNCTQTLELIAALACVLMNILISIYRMYWRDNLNIGSVPIKTAMGVAAHPPNLME